MNKKVFFCLFAAAGMLSVTSCSNEELDTLPGGNEAQVCFSLGLEGGMGSRTISDGTGAKKLVYAVYNSEGQIIKTIENADVNGQIVNENAFNNAELTEHVTITLAKGQEYTVAFWAQNPSCTAYETTDLENVTINYAGVNNDETRDAFFKAETFTVSGSTTIDVELKRPFAQVNVGVHQSDWDAAVASGVKVLQSKVTIDNAATALNVLTGTVDGEETVDYSLANIPAESLYVDMNGDGVKEPYVYLSMSYILPNDQSTGYAQAALQEVAFTFDPENGNDILLKEGLTAVPVQRNWRTNIIGQILTGNITFEVTIEPLYDGEFNNGTAQPVSINGVYYPTIQAAIDNVQNGEVISISTGTYTEVLDLTGAKTFTIEAAGPDVVVAAIGHETNGTPSVVTVKGITIDNSLTPAGWYTGTGNALSPCVGLWGGNISFEDCTFIVAGTSNMETGVMTWWTTAENVTTLNFSNCKFVGKDDHASARAMQIYGHVNMTVKDCEFTTYKDYTLKYVGETGTVATLENNVVKNSEYFVELGSSSYAGDSYTVNIINNTFGEGVNAYVIANEENQVVNVSGNVQVVAEDLIKDAAGNYVASSENGIKAAMDLNVSELCLTANTYAADKFQVKGRTITLKGIEDNVVLHVTQTNAVAMGTFDGSNVTFENMTIKTNTGIYKGFARMQGTYNRCNFENCYFTFQGKHVFNNCVLNSNNEEHCVWTYGASEVEFNGCHFNYGDRCVNVYTEMGIADGVVNCSDCTFITGNTASKGAIEINSGSFANSVAVKMNKCVAPAYGKMVFISGWDSENGSKATVTIDGTVVDVPQMPK